MKKFLPIMVAAIFAASPAIAAEKNMDHDHGDHYAHDHDDHEKHDHADEHSDGATTFGAPLSLTPEIASALDAGGEPIVADVLGVVCDFCAKAMNKTFGKRDEVAAVYVDLDAKTLSLVLKPATTLDDVTIEKLVKKSGYRLSEIRRGAAALKGIENAPDHS